MSIKISSIFIGLILILSICSGCTLLSFFDSTTFTLLSSNIIDDEGFTTLFLEFNVSDQVVVKVVDPQNALLFTHDYYKGSHTEYIVLDRYRTTPDPGLYQIKAYDSYDQTIFEKGLFLIDYQVLIDDIDAYWWTADEQTHLLGVAVSLTNTGDLPAYPDMIQVSVDGRATSGYVLPCVLVPGQRTTIYGSVYLEDVSLDDASIHVSIITEDAVTIAQQTQAVDSSTYLSDLDYSWRYSQQQTIDLPDVVFLYEYYSSLDRLVLEDYAAYIFDRYDNQLIQVVADRILSLTDAESDSEIVNFVASFVQALEYAEDDEFDETCEYPRYPVEMLKDAEGDCEDKAMLTATLLDTLGYNVTLLRLPNHMAVGVHLDDELSSFEYYIDEYYYLETTRVRWEVGKIPEEYEGLSDITLHPLTSRPLLTHQWKNATRITSTDGQDYVTVKMIVGNLGTASASNFRIDSFFIDSSNTIYNKQSLNVAVLKAGYSTLVELVIDVPQTQSSTLKTQIFLDGKMVSEKESTSTFP